ncbi:phosphatidylinositol-glycan biosynthesis class F protein [Acrasis kona]|uniref:Phosphatidylinositol-glycan biosynthesis class F protein n=1 Tax=Acrasis kona TaxID=1008807 RepID=A0AAW2ZLG9_9EUKA
MQKKHGGKERQTQSTNAPTQQISIFALTLVINISYFFIYWKNIQTEYQNTLKVFLSILLSAQALAVTILYGFLPVLQYIKVLSFGVVGFSIIAFTYGSTIDINLPIWALLVAALVIAPHYNYLEQSLFKLRAASALVVVWASAFVIPLDWDRPWQLWPICCTYGAILGSLAPLLVVVWDMFVGRKVKKE